MKELIPKGASLALYLYFFYCISAYGQAIVPPSLLFPSNADTVLALYPTFTWSVSSLSTDKHPTYKIRIVELIGNQTPEAAMQANPDWYMQSDLNHNLFSYPISAPSFQKNKRYAWQVSIQYVENVSAGEVPATQTRVIESEVHTFVSKDDMSDEQCVPFLFEKLDERFYVFNDFTLKFKLREGFSDKAEKLTYKIVDMKGKLVVEQPVSPIKSETGGYYSIALQKYEPFRKKSAKGKFYCLEAHSLEGKVYKLKFACN